MERLHKMVEYASRSDICRSRFLLAYFGESDAGKCGQCDVCRRRQEIQITREEFESIRDTILNHLMEQKRTTGELIDIIDYPEDKVIRVIDWLLDNDHRITTREGELFLTQDRE